MSDDKPKREPLKDDNILPTRKDYGDYVEKDLNPLIIPIPNSSSSDSDSGGSDSQGGSDTDSK